MIQRVGDLFEAVSNGLVVQQSKSGRGVPVTRIETISSGDIDLQRVGYADLSLSDNRRWLLKPSDILFSHINSPERVGTCALYDAGMPPLIHGMNLLRLTPRREKIDPRFAIYLLRSAPFRAMLQPFINKAVNQASVSSTNLKSIKVDVPTLAEQRRIAALLDGAAQLRIQGQQAAVNLSQLSVSVYLDMFGHPLDNPRNWPKAPIEDLGNVTTGKTPPTRLPGMFDGPIPFVTPGDLGLESRPKRSLTYAGAEKSRVVRQGATLVCCIGTIGKIGVARSRSAFNQQINAVEWNERIDDDYGYMTIRLLRPLLSGRGSSTTVPILSKSQFARIDLPVPPVDMQAVFGPRVRAIEAMKEGWERRLQHCDGLFASIQSGAFAVQGR